MSTITKYIILILIALLVGWNIRISTNDDYNDNMCPPPEEYVERGNNDESNK